MENRKSVAMASSSSVGGSVSYVSKPKKLRTAELDNNVLNPDEELFMRLDTTNYHLEDKANSHSMCSLHRWLGFDTQICITYCETCNVNICTNFFKYFHVTPDISSEKILLSRKIYKEHYIACRHAKKYRDISEEKFG